MRIRIPTETLWRAEFEMWLPKGMDKDNPPKGVIVLCPGSNGDGRSLVHGPEWKNFADHHGMALLGVFFQDKNPTGIEGYCKAGDESGGALLWALDEYAEKLKIPAIRGLKLFVFGFSAGGQFAYEMNANYPSRVAGFVANKGGIYYSALVPEAARRNPGLMIYGKKDDSWRKAIIQGLWAVNRRGGCPWQLIGEEVGHDIGQSEDIAMKFFENILVGNPEEIKVG